MSLMERLVKMQEKCVEEVALVLTAMGEGGTIYVTEEDKIVRRADGYYYINERTKDEAPVDPATAVYMFLTVAADRAAKNLYG